MALRTGEDSGVVAHPAEGWRLHRVFSRREQKSIAYRITAVENATRLVSAYSENRESSGQSHVISSSRSRESQRRAACGGPSSASRPEGSRAGRRGASGDSRLVSRRRLVRRLWPPHTGAKHEPARSGRVAPASTGIRPTGRDGRTTSCAVRCGAASASWLIRAGDRR